MKKIVIRICSLCSTLILILAVAVCAALLVPKMFHFEIFSVLSGSMEPTYHVGSVVYIDTSVEADEIKAGDPIAFYKEAGIVATHRAIGVDKDKEQFTTKGDANSVTDADPIAFSQLIGKAVFTIPLIGYVSIYIKTSKGIIAVTALVVVLILLYAIPSLLEPEKGGKTNEKK